MTYKHAIGSVASTTRSCVVYFDNSFFPLGIVTVKQGSQDFDADAPLLIVEHGTTPGNSGSRIKAYAVMVPSGLIGYIHESDLKKVRA